MRYVNGLDWHLCSEGLDFNFFEISTVLGQNLFGVFFFPVGSSSERINDEH
jgi:hypothetical protein